MICIKSPYDSSEKWHTILIVPFGRGGNGFTVLDVTNPDKPLHLYTVFNNHIKNTVMVMNHLNVLSQYEYIDDTYSFSQPISKLFPQTDRDNPVSDPESSKCYALSNPVGEVVVDEVKNSITREGIDKTFSDLGVGIAITDIRSNQTGAAHTI